MIRHGLLAGSALLLLSGCGGGGGGGGGVNSTPTPPTTTTTTPTPPPPPPPVVNYSDAEYSASNAASDAKAIQAWNAGATGAGVTLAILDSGLSDPRGEFTGRISSASTSISDTAAYADTDGHGTMVAAVAAASHNGSLMEGVAFGATVMALRSDTTGTCGTTDGCSFNTNTLSIAIDYARQHGARVINMSLGGGGTTSQLRAAIDRATSAGIIVVIAAGNDATAQPDVLAQEAADPSARGLVIIAGAHDATGAPSSFTDKAGDYARYYLSALGTKVETIDNKGTLVLASGTSFAAPAVSAAVALLEQAFPNLTPAQVIQLLYTSATDAGAAGVDSVYGNGLLNLTKAFQPAGTASLAGSIQPVSMTTNAVLSGAMGDATLSSAGLTHTVILDSYGRAFSVDLSGTVAHIGQSRPLSTAIAGNMLVREQSFGAAHVSFTLARDVANAPWVGMAQRGLTPNGVHSARAVAGSATMAISRATSAGFGFAQSGRQIGNLLDGTREAGSFLVARTPADGPGFDGVNRMAMAVRHRLGAVTLDATGERGQLPALLGKGDRPSYYTLMTMRAGRRFGRITAALGMGVMNEAESVLGARFGPALGGRGATTTMADADLTLDLGHGWMARGQWRRGWTDPAAGGALTGGTLRTASSAFDLGHAGRHIRFGMRYSEPTRVTSGGFNLSVPVSYDYASGAVGYAPATLDLSPAGHERDVEANVGLRVAGGWLDGNLFWRRQPGNLLLAPDDRGAAIRYGVDF